MSLFPSLIMNTAWKNAWNIAIKEKNKDLDSPKIVGALENILGHGEKNMIFERRGGGNIEFLKIYTPGKGYTYILIYDEYHNSISKMIPTHSLISNIESLLQIPNVTRF